MSSLYASRWAATPPAEEPPPKPAGSDLFASRWASTPPEEKDAESNTFGPRQMDTPPLGEPAQSNGDGEERLGSAEEPSVPSQAEEIGGKNVEAAMGEEEEEAELPKVEPALETSNAELIEENMKIDPDTGMNLEKPLPEVIVNETAKDEDAKVEPVDVAPVSPSKSRLDAPRLKKKVSWRGKTCVVSIPNIDYDALGLTKPLGLDEVQSRLKHFEEAGYSTEGFDMPIESDLDDSPVYSKSIYPTEGETRPGQQMGRPVVTLPDLAKWASYMDELTEKKLAALGVSTGLEEPLAAPSPTASRQSSAQYPPLPFSPPLPSTSAASLGRPGMIRSHSHAMSVASPISPLNGPMGHMHRHSTFSGPSSLQQIQQAMQQAGNNGPAAFLPREQLAALQTSLGLRLSSPSNQFAASAYNPVASPVQFGALQNESNPFRGSGSPLNQHTTSQSALDYSKALAEDQLGRHNAFAQISQQGPSPNGFPPGPVMQSTPALPQLPEEEEEAEVAKEPSPEPEKQPDRPAYVPPHKRAELNANIVTPTPRGHRHNISEGLEREIRESEQRHEDARQNYIEVEEESSGQVSQSEDSAARSAPAVEKDPLSQDYTVQETVHSHKKSASRFNVTAPAFKFNPGASFQPAATTFTFGAPPPQPPQASGGHRRQVSSGAFNVAAPEFKPAGVPSLPKSEFSFSASGPSFVLKAPPSVALGDQQQSSNIEGSSIFGKVEIPAFVKPARRSKAIAIKKPEDAIQNASVSNSEVEDAEGRIAQSEDRLKRQRKVGGSGDEIPKFAEPAPIPAPAPNLILKSQRDVPVEESGQASSAEAASGSKDDEGNVPKDDAESVDAAFDHDFDRAYGDHKPSEPNRASHSHQRSTSLSALAQPFAPRFPSNTQRSPSQEKAEQEYESDLEDGEIKEDVHPPTSPPEARESSILSPVDEREVTPSLPLMGGDTVEVMTPPVDGEPSFAEIDAVMRQLNEAEEEQSAQESSSISPLPSPGSHPMPGVTYLPGPEWTRSDAPSPSPRRRPQHFNSHADSSFTMHDLTDGGERAMNGSYQVNRLNKAAEVPNSDWSADFFVQDDEKLNQRSNMLDSHIDNLIGRVLDKRLQPLEDSLMGIQNALSKRPTSRDLVKKRSSSLVESDADDEDELSEEQRQRPISRGKEKKVDHIKIAVAEALREQSPQRRSQQTLDMQHLHSYLADMKASFARAASGTLELEDIRAIVEEAVEKQNEALMPIAVDASEKERAHRKQKSELEARLNQTLAGMLEEANLRRAAEEREAESRRMLQQAEDELRSLRDSSRADDSRITAAVREKDELLHRLEQAEESQRDMEEQVKNLEAENAATYATLEEYRMSSSKWRQNIDQATQERGNLEEQVAELKQQLEDSQESSNKRREDIDQALKERDELENTINGLERQLSESHESGNSMRRRLEKLHTDMANAAGQLASEKSTWRAREEEHRSKCDSLEAQVAAHATSRAQLEEELRVLRADAREASEARSVLDQMKTSHSSLDDLVRSLQSDLAEQQSLAARFERDFNDAKDNARAEINRVRVSMETDVETANHQVNVVRSELEGELSKVRMELESVKMEAENAKARHEHVLEEQDGVKREALKKVNLANSLALDEARQKHDISLKQLQADHQRAINHATEDKQRAEMFLNERLVLSDAKLQLFQDKVLHLEERLEITKSAAQAAAISAQSKAAAQLRAAPSVPAAASASYEKISPQALRESILVLQEQLQDRESLIEKLQSQVDNEGPAKAKARDEEIAWLRELLANRSEELTDLINTLARPVFDRTAVRDTAIRIRANLQMEQQEKERINDGSQSLSEQAMASLSNFATPKAVQLSSAFNKWRSSMESSSLKNTQRGASRPGSSTRPGSVRPRSNTPSKASAPAPAANPPALMHGLMTPPASNLRNTPSPDVTASMPPPRLNSRPGSQAGNVSMSGPAKLKSRQASNADDAPLAPLFRSQSYDRDAEDNNDELRNFEESVDEGAEEGAEDDSLDDIPDDQPPAFRSLETELEDVGGDGAME